MNASKLFSNLTRRQLPDGIEPTPPAQLSRLRVAVMAAAEEMAADLPAMYRPAIRAYLASVSDDQIRSAIAKGKEFLSALEAISQEGVECVNQNGVSQNSQ